MKVLRLMFGAVVTLAAIFLIAPSSPAGAATSISARVERTEIDFGVSSYVVGNVTPRRAGETVVLERGFTSSWSERGRAVTDANGGFRILIRPSQTGIYKFRMRSGSVVSPTFYLRVWRLTYLDTFRPVQSLEGLDSASIKMNGVTYSRGLWESDICGSSGGGWCYSDYDLSRRYAKFNTTVGLLDNSDSRAQVTYEILLDGVPVASGTVRLGVVRSVAVPASGKLRLRIQYRYVQGSAYSADIGFGNPTLRN